MKSLRTKTWLYMKSNQGNKTTRQIDKNKRKI